MIIETLSIVITFISLIIGIFGNTWNNQKRGLRKLTFTGWLTIFVGLSFCIIGILKNFQNQAEINWQENKKEKLKIIAYEELTVTIDNLLIPFTEMYVEAPLRFDVEIDCQKFYDDENFRYSELLSKKFISIIDTSYHKGNPETATSYWNKHFSVNAKRNQIKLNEIILKYSLYIDLETILQIDSLINSPFFTNMTGLEDRGIPVSFDQLKSYGKNDNFIDRYYEYIKLLRTIKLYAKKYASS